MHDHIVSTCGCFSRDGHRLIPCPLSNDVRHVVDVRARKPVTSKFDPDERREIEAALGGVTEGEDVQREVVERAIIAGTVGTALQRMTRRVAEAAKDMGGAQDTIKELGLDAGRLADLAPDRQFYAIAATLQRVGSQIERTRMALELFDSGGVAVLQALENGIVILRDPLDQHKNEEDGNA